MTLPLIYALNQAEATQRRYIIGLVRRHNENPEKVKEVIDFVRQSGGIQYTEQVMLKFRQEAFDILDTFPVSEARQALRELVVFVTERKK